MVQDRKNHEHDIQQHAIKLEQIHDQLQIRHTHWQGIANSVLLKQIHNQMPCHPLLPIPLYFTLKHSKTTSSSHINTSIQQCRR